MAGSICVSCCAPGAVVSPLLLRSSAVWLLGVVFQTVVNRLNYADPWKGPNANQPVELACLQGFARAEGRQELCSNVLILPLQLG